jgi:hypothetical protein
MDVTDSDHKPVCCIFSVDIARVDESVRRQEFGDIMKSNEEIRYIIDELSKIPETIVSTNNIILPNQDTTILRITNKCGENDALFEIICEGQSIIDENGQASDHHPRGSYGFPQWLEVSSLLHRKIYSNNLNCSSYPLFGPFCWIPDHIDLDLSKKIWETVKMSDSIMNNRALTPN